MKRGFTFIELMIVIAIMGIISAIAIPSYKRYVNGHRTVKIYHLEDGKEVQCSYHHMEECGLRLIGCDNNIKYRCMRNIQIEEKSLMISSESEFGKVGN